MTTTLTPLFPEIDPHTQGWIDVSGGHSVYYEICGNPNGEPVVFLHGGPGSGCNSSQRRFFDPSYYRIVLFDQRGCGRSRPLGEVESNSTDLLVSDIEQLRNHIGVNRWLVFGGSWGSTLALAYAAKHPRSISGLILRGIFLARQSELEWFLYSVRQFHPEAWNTLVARLSSEEREDILRTYHKKVFSGDIEAARTWNAFESSIMTLLPPPPGKATDDSITMARARVQLHYLTNQCFLSQPLLNQVERFRSTPAIIIQGRYDMVCPPISADDLHHAWPEAEYVVIPDAGHSAMEPGIASALIFATEQFKRQG